jgi:hypothetical protein
MKPLHVALTVTVAGMWRCAFVATRNRYPPITRDFARYRFGAARTIEGPAAHTCDSPRLLPDLEKVFKSRI